ncbi:hypothetical protein VNO77_03597 [Canavalia gladiata]|uniref:Uncharacterized protein n=1 Tax=Canavalia gladiata TaxID=3824 RepID=A0AAN9N021_CANGL
MLLDMRSYPSMHLQPSRPIPTHHNSSSKANFLVQDGGGVMGHIPHSTPQHWEHFLVWDYKHLGRICTGGIDQRWAAHLKGKLTSPSLLNW